VADYGKPRRRQVDPLLAVAAEAAGAGLRGADYVVEGLSEGLRRRTRSRSAGRAAGRQRAAQARSPLGRSGSYGGTTPPAHEGPPPPGTGRTADLLVELLDRFGEAVQDIAAAIGEREWFAAEPDCPTLELRGVPGHSAGVEFDFTNTGPSALAKVVFKATDLLGATTQIDAREVSFQHEEYPHIPRVGPGGRARVTVTVTVPQDTPDGTYRGLIAARSAAPAGRGEAEGGPHDAWSLIELEVGATDPRSPIAPVERTQEA
jgi:hypothetical protein